MCCSAADASNQILLCYRHVQAILISTNAVKLELDPERALSGSAYVTFALSTTFRIVKAPYRLASHSEAQF
jgi:hypothetical protein